MRAQFVLESAACCVMSEGVVQSIVASARAADTWKPSVVCLVVELGAEPEVLLGVPER